MNRIVLVVLAIVFLCSLALAAQPELQEAKIEPKVVESGDKAKITMEFSGSKEDIKEIYFVVREYVDEAPRYSLYPDAASKNNVWILEERIPYDAPIGTLTLDVTAIDKDGKKIVSKNMDKEALGTTASIKVEIKY